MMAPLYDGLSVETQKFIGLQDEFIERDRGLTKMWIALHICVDELEHG